MAERVTQTSSWKDLALCLGLDLDGWDELSGLGPPHYPHSEDHVLAFFQKLQRNNSLAASASYTEESPEPSSVDFGRDSESEVSAELKRNKQAPTRNKNKASKSKKAKTEETPLEPVSEEKPAEQLDNARETTSKKEDEAPGNVQRQKKRKLLSLPPLQLLLSLQLLRPARLQLTRAALRLKRPRRSQRMRMRRMTRTRRRRRRTRTTTRRKRRRAQAQ